MTRFYKILRALLVVLIAMAVVIPMVTYVGLSLPSFQRQIIKVAQREMSRQLGARVEVGALTIAPFNRLMLRDVVILERMGGDTIVTVDRLGAGINLYELVTRNNIVVNYAEIIGLDARLERDSIGAPLNIQPIIDRLKSTEPRPESRFTMAINTVLMRNCSFRYFVRDTGTHADAGDNDYPRFSPDNIFITDFSTDVLLPHIGNQGGKAIIKRLRIKEQSGLEVTGLSATVKWEGQNVTWEGLKLELPQSLVMTNGRIVGDTVNSVLLTGSFINPIDLAPLQPVLKDFSEKINIAGRFNGTLSDYGNLTLNARSATRSFELGLSAMLISPLDSINRAIDNVNCNIKLDTDLIASLLPPSTGNASAILGKLGNINLHLTGSADMNKARAQATVKSQQGNADLTCSVRELSSRTPRYEARLDLDDVRLGYLLKQSRLGNLTLSATTHGSLVNKLPDGTLDLKITELGLNGHPLSNIVSNLTTHGPRFNLSLNSDDPAASFSITASGDILSRFKDLKLAATMKRIDLGELTDEEKFMDMIASLNLDADLSGSNVDDIDGNVSIRGIELKGRPGQKLSFNGLKIESMTGENDYRTITLESDLLTGTISGIINPSSLGRQLPRLATQSLPALLQDEPAGRNNSRHGNSALFNDFAFQFTINETEQWADCLKLPVSVLGHGELHGSVNSEDGNLSVVLDLPYLRQGNKLIEQTRLQASVVGRDSVSDLSFVTHFPTKHGPLALDFNSHGTDNDIYSTLQWSIDRVARYDGNLSANTRLARSQLGLNTTVTINPGNLTFNDSTWTINPAVISINPGVVTIDGLNAHRSGQFVKIDGRASRDPQDVVTVDLLGVNLDYIFESLGIDKVMLGGDATGCFYASNLYSPEPHLLTDGLVVHNISYNKVVLGDALVKSSWDTERRAITLDAIVEQKNKKPTTIDGAIFPLNDSIDITFDAQDVNIGFLHPYMSAFAADVSGKATGKVRLWGNFKYIDIEGDVAADDVAIKVAFTNTTYSTSDTIKLRLGEITLDNLVIKDIFGNTGVLDGKVWHKYFKEPEFDFVIKDVNNMLVYDETSRQNPDWYGRIFASGSAHIDGRPGIVNIGVDMTTSPGSMFTFVLNDMEEASDYSFITYRDRDALIMGENEQLVDDTPNAVKRLRELLAMREDEESSAYNIDLLMNVTPDARIDLVMDPAGGDRIRSWGNGNMRMTYGSSDNDLHMYGSYTLEKGNYNFTLQDIIIKDFTIKPGSSISFTGDPFSAMLDIKAIYALNANLSDLDESFLQDKDLNRTKVPVHAVLQVTGPLTHPDIGFDLEFPTLTQDTYRKVRSIVSTDDMMNRQIIYLLALNRFYTPDYMASATRGNELVSVVSSTISSQLGNILGNLSDKWNIAPTFRSDREDFSDVEVDVALSSSLLNNRLLFNGNFGYRDKSLNSTQFVGDFDIEYLLNRAGTVRLKAYNRYNDQNYYVRTADTTQGVGISFRRNFDSLKDLLKSFHRNKAKAKTSEPVKEEPRDTSATVAPILP